MHNLIKITILFMLIPIAFVACENKEVAEKQSEPKETQTINYGEYTDEIENLLSAIPLGSDIYLEEQESGDWYLKIEKTFTTQSQSQKVKKDEPIYGESILI